jgi:Cof subfamily protein (haloacid dehalogenase superfamily)
MTFIDLAAPVNPLPGLIVFDVDGTLLTSDNRITKRTHRVLVRLAPRVKFAIASARAPSELVNVLQALPLDSFAIAHQGAWLGQWQGSGFSISRETRLANRSARSVAAKGLSLGLTLGWFEGAEWWVTEIDRMVTKHVAITGLQPHVDPATPVRRTRPHKLMFMAPEPALEPALISLASSVPPNCATHQSEQDYLEVTAAGVDKGHALVELAALLRIPMSATMAFGNGDNDVSLLSRAGHGVAMLSGTDAARSAARWLTRGNDDDGIAFGLEAVFGPR